MQEGEGNEDAKVSRVRLWKPYTRIRSLGFILHAFENFER